jgi:hypothetical protein
MQTWKVCPRYKGKLYIDSDFNGWYIEYLMAGFSYDLDEVWSVEPEESLILSQHTI